MDSEIEIEFEGEVHIISHEDGHEHRTKLEPEVVLALLEDGIVKALTEYMDRCEKADET